MREYIDHQPRCSFTDYHRKDDESQTKLKQRQQIEISGNHNIASQRQEGFDYTGKYFYIFEDSSAASSNFGYTHMCWDATSHCRICQADINIHFFHSKSRSTIPNSGNNNYKISDEDPKRSDNCKGYDENIISEGNSSILDDGTSDQLSYSKITFRKKTPLAVSERRRTLYDNVNNQLLFIVEPKEVDWRNQMSLRIYKCPVTHVTNSRVQEFDFSGDDSTISSNNDYFGNINIEPSLILTYQGNFEFHYQFYQDQSHKTLLGVFAKNDQIENGFVFELIEIQGRSSKDVVVGNRITLNAETTFSEMSKNQDSNRINNNDSNIEDVNGNNTNITKKHAAKSGRQYMRQVMNMVEECKIRFYIQGNKNKNTSNTKEECSKTSSIFFTNFPDSRDILECCTAPAGDRNKITRYTITDDIDTESFQHCKDNIFMSYTPETGQVNILQLKSGSISVIKTVSFSKPFGDTIQEESLQHPVRCQLLAPFPGKYIIDAQYEDKETSNMIR